MTNTEYLTEKEVADQYPIFRVKTLQTWRQLKRGPRFVRIGGRVFYPRTEIDQYIQANLVDTTSAA